MLRLDEIGMAERYVDRRLGRLFGISQMMS